MNTIYKIIKRSKFIVSNFLDEPGANYNAPRPLTLQEMNRRRYDKIGITIVISLFILRETISFPSDNPCDKLSLQLKRAEDEVPKFGSAVDRAETNLVKTSRQQRRALERLEKTQARKASCETSAGFNITACAKERNAFSKALMEAGRENYRFNDAHMAYTRSVHKLNDVQADYRKTKQNFGRC